MSWGDAFIDIGVAALAVLVAEVVALVAYGAWIAGLI
jgi:hypothetical protein